MTAEEKIKFEQAQKEISEEKEVFDSPWSTTLSGAGSENGRVSGPYYVVASLETLNFGKGCS